MSCVTRARIATLVATLSLVINASIATSTARAAASTGLACLRDALAPVRKIPAGLDSYLVVPPTPLLKDRIFVGDLKLANGSTRQIYTEGDIVTLRDEDGSIREFTTISKGQDKNWDEPVTSASNRWHLILVSQKDGRGEPVLVDALSGTSRTLPDFKRVRSAYFDPAESTLYGFKDGTEILRVDLMTGRQTRIPIDFDFIPLAYLPERKSLVQITGNQIMLLDLETGRLKFVPLQGVSEYQDYQVMTVLGDRAVLNAPDPLPPGAKKDPKKPDYDGMGPHSLIMIDLNSGTIVQRVKIPGESFPELSPDSTYAYVTVSDEVYDEATAKMVTDPSKLRGGFVLDLVKGTTTKVHDAKYAFTQYAKDSSELWIIAGVDKGPQQLIRVNLRDGSRRVIDLKVRDQVFVLGRDQDGKYLYLSRNDGDISEVGHDGDAEGGSGLVKSILRVRLDSGQITELQLPPETYSVELTSEGTRVLLSRSQLVPLANWSEVASASATATLPRSKEAQLKACAQAASRPKFDVALDLPVVHNYLASKLYREHPEHITPLLASILERNPFLYRQLISRYPDIAQVVSSVPLDQSLPKARAAAWSRAAKSYLESKLKRITEDQENLMFADVQDLAPLRPFLAKIPADQRSETIRVLANNITETAITDSLNGVPRPLVFKLIKRWVREYFGEKGTDMTDVQLVREGNRITPTIVGTRPIDGRASTGNDFGYYSKNLKSYRIPKDAKPETRVIDDKITWTQGPDKFTASVQVSTLKIDANSIVPPDKQPKYDQLWSDGALTGLVVSGENLDTDAPMVLDEYLEYYREKGFKFEKKDDVPIDDFVGFLQKEVTSGRLDYFVKEAHADGDERNLFRVLDKGILKVGTRKLKTGRTERVMIFVPDTSVKVSHLIPNNDFGAWVRDRAAAGKGQLIYLNTSCFGNDKAAAEEEAALSPIFVDIAGETMQSTFVDEADSSIYQILEGIRAGKTYEQMRQMMKDNNPAYKTGEEDVLVLPDEPKYDELIRNKIKRPVRIDVKVLDAKGRPYNLDRVD